MDSKITDLHIVGFLSFQSDLKLEEVAKVISSKLFGGLEFGGLGECIHEEIPAVFLKNGILGMQIIIDGYPGFSDQEWFTLHISTISRINKQPTIKINLSKYLYNLFNYYFANTPEIVVMETKANFH